MAGDAPYENMLANVKPDSTYRAVASTLLSKVLESLNDRIRRRLAEARDLAEPVVGDVFYIMYSYNPILKPPHAINNPVLRALAAYFHRFMETERYRSLRAVTTLNKEASTVYALRFARVFLEELLRLLPPPGAGARGGTRLPCRAVFCGKTRRTQHTRVDVERAVEEAAKRAEEEASTAVQAYLVLPIAGYGRDPARIAFLDRDPAVSKVEFKTVIKLLAGLRRGMPLLFAQPKRVDPLGTPEGYTLARNPGNALARELALPEELFTAKLAGAGFTARERRLTPPGAMIVLLDKSGSMLGYKLAWAKAVAYALAVKARKKRMEWVLIPFDGSPLNPITLDNAEELLKIHAGGGTSIAHALLAAFKLAKNKKYKRVNVVVITDGVDGTIQAYEEVILREARRAKARVKAIYIEGSNETLKRIAAKTGGQLLTVEPDGRDALRVVNAV